MQPRIVDADRYDRGRILQRSGTLQGACVQTGEAEVRTQLNKASASERSHGRSSDNDARLAIPPIPSRAREAGSALPAGWTPCYLPIEGKIEGNRARR